MKWIEFQKGKKLYSFNHFREISIVHYYLKRSEKFKEDSKEKNITYHSSLIKKDM